MQNKRRWAKQSGRFDGKNIAELENEIDTLSIVTNAIDGFSHFNESQTLTMSWRSKGIKSIEVVSVVLFGIGDMFNASIAKIQWNIMT